MTPPSGVVRWRAGGLHMNDPRRSVNNDTTYWKDDHHAKVVDYVEEAECYCGCGKMGGWICVHYAEKSGFLPGNGIHKTEEGVGKWTYSSQRKGHIVGQLSFATRVEVPCVHLQYYIEACWDLILPFSATLRSGLDWSRGFCCYFVEIVDCRKQFSIQRYLDGGCKEDEGVIEKFCEDGMMVGIEGIESSDHRLIPITALNAACFLGAWAVYFPDRLARDVYARRFAMYLPCDDAVIDISADGNRDGEVVGSGEVYSIEPDKKYYKMTYVLPDRYRLPDMKMRSFAYYDKPDTRALLVLNPVFKYRHAWASVSLEDMEVLEFVRNTVSSMWFGKEVIDWQDVYDKVVTYPKCRDTACRMLALAHMTTPEEYGIMQLLGYIASMCHSINKDVNDDNLDDFNPGAYAVESVIFGWGSINERLRNEIVDLYDEMDDEKKEELRVEIMSRRPKFLQL
jgi:hypothetical protein